MKKYQKPVLEVVELAVAENIAALVPKTIYKREGSLVSRNIQMYELDQNEGIS